MMTINLGRRIKEGHGKPFLGTRWTIWWEDSVCRGNNEDYDVTFTQLMTYVRREMLRTGPLQQFNLTIRRLDK